MFNGGNSGFSLADIAAAVNGGNRNNGDFGGNGAWWVLIILFALWSGNGNGVFGNRNGNNCGGCCGSTTYVPVPMGGYGMGGVNYGFSEAAMQRGFDNQTVINKLDGLNAGICSLGYDQLAQFNGINQNISQTGFALSNQYQQGQIAGMQQFNALSSQLSQCCCDNKAQIAELKYDMATSDCSIKTLINQVAQQIMWGQQNGLRDLTELINTQFCQLKMDQKDAVIAELRAQLASCGQNSALQALYTQLVSTLQPTAVPAYPASNPNGMGNWAPETIANNGFNCGCRNNCHNCC